MHPTFQTSQKIFPVIDLGNGFILREKQDSDVENFFSYYSNPEVNQFILCEIPTQLEEARRELHYWRGTFYQNDGIYFAIAEKNSNRMVGSIGLTGHSIYHSRIEISYDLSREYWGRGIMTTAIKEVVKYAFEVIGVNRIEASVSILNIPSKNLLQKCGFAVEGILRQHRYHRGNYVDVYFFSLLRDEYLLGQAESSII
jgi:ribosomal-protein-alanine N-acetyltransferase